MQEKDCVDRNPPPTLKGQRTRKLILEAARRVLNVNGYRDARISDIIHEAKLPTGTFYRYFDGKVDVTLQVLLELARNYTERVPNTSTTSIFERELAAHQRLIDLYEVNPGVINCYFSSGEKEEGLVRFFHEQTDRFVEAYFLFVREHGGVADLTAKDFYPIGGALIGMSENLVYRLLTRARGRRRPQWDEVALTLAVCRHRAITGTDPKTRLPAVFSALHAPRGRPRSGTVVDQIDSQFENLAGGTIIVPGPVGLRVDSKATLKQIERITLELLDRYGYEDLRLSDIEESSGITRGAIYHHYTDKDALIRKVLRDRLETIDDALTIVTAHWGAADISAFDKLLLLARTIVGQFAETAGVLSVLHQLENKDLELMAAYDSKWSRWVSMISSLLYRHAGGRIDSPSDLRLIADAFLAMAERLLRDLYVAPFSKLKVAIKSCEAAAILLAALWYRMAFRADLPDFVVAKFPFFAAQKPASPSSARLKRRN